MNNWCRICKNNCLQKDKKFIKNYEKLIRNRPLEKEEYFQGHASMESVICRICAICNKEKLNDKQIIIFGDDDLISLGLSLYCNMYHKTCEITVIDIDKDLLNFISSKSFYNIRCIYYNVYVPLPKILINKFDIFITDPYENISYIKSCIDRGVESIKHDGVGYVGLPNREGFFKTYWKEIMKYFLDNNLLFTDLVFTFHTYPKWSESALIRVIKI